MIELGLLASWQCKGQATEKEERHTQNCEYTTGPNPLITNPALRVQVGGIAILDQLLIDLSMPHESLPGANIQPGFGQQHENAVTHL